MTFRILYNSSEAVYGTNISHITEQLLEDNHTVYTYPADEDDETAWVELWNNAPIEFDDFVIIYFHGSNFHAGPMLTTTIEKMKYRAMSNLMLITCNAVREIGEGEFLQKGFGMKMFEHFKPDKFICPNAQITLSTSPRVLYLPPSVKIVVKNKPKDEFNSLYVFYGEGRRPSDIGGKFRSFTSLVEKIISV